MKAKKTDMEKPVMSDRSAIKHFENRRAQLLKERNTWESSARELAEHILPEYDRYGGLHRHNKGDVGFDSILDSTATLASEILSSGLMSGVTNPARRWVKLSFPNLAFSQDGPIQEWLEDVTKVMLEVFARSNLYNVLPSLYQEIGVFGTGAIYVQEDDEDIIRCWNFAPGEYCVATDAGGRVNTCYRDFTMTVNQLVEHFGLHNVCKQTQSLYKGNNGQQAIHVTHVIEPVDVNLDLDKKIPLGSKFRSVYFERGRGMDEDRGFLNISGYQEFPVMVPRWNTVSNDVYGYGRGHKCLGDIKQLQYQTRAKVEAVEKQVRPPLKAPVGTNPGQVSTMPDHISFYNSVDQAGIGAMYQVNLDMNAIREDIAVLQDRINRFFYVDAFRMLSQLADRSKTATEVHELREEKLLALGSVLQRLNDELLDPLVDRVFGILLRRGIIPEPPAEVEGEPIRVEYLSVLAQAQKSEGTQSIERLVGFFGQIAQSTGDPSIFDKINVDELADNYAELLGVSPKIVVDTETADEGRAERAQLAQAQQNMQMAQQGVDMAKSAGEIPGEANSDMIAQLLQNLPN
jgi:hypothetical protein